MKSIVVFGLVCVALVGELAQAVRLSSHEWTLFKSTHGKSYASEAEEARRFANFMATKQRVERHNAQSGSSFKMGLNHLADWTQEELATLNGLKLDENTLTRVQEQSNETEAYLAEILASSNDPAPEEFDWRKVPGRVTDIKDQGQCGSCWAFAAVGVLEGQEIVRVYNETKKVIQLSEQELVDCSDSNNGCKNGIMSAAFDDLKGLGGIVRAREYPYTGVTGLCVLMQKQRVMTDSGAIVLPAGDEEKMKQMLFKYGPISVAMQATDNFQTYRSGVLIDDMCTSRAEDVNHGVLLVGYGNDPNHGRYWVVKNSWSNIWGEDGYFKIKRGMNMCSIASLPTIAKF